MDELLLKIKDSLGNNDDLFFQEKIYFNHSIVLLGLKNIVDFPKTLVVIHNHLEFGNMNNVSIEMLIKELGEKLEPVSNKAVSSILEGNLLIYSPENRLLVKITPFPKTLTRSISPPTNENHLQGSLSSFNEDMGTNLGLLRKEIVSDSLLVQTFSVGGKHKKSISIIYDQKFADKKLVQKIIKQVQAKENIDVNHLQDMNKVLGISLWSPLFQYNTTELPQEAVHFILKGRIIMFVDRIPFALVIPSLFWDMFAAGNDYNYPFLIMLCIRSLRIIGVLITLIVPGLYVALVAVNPEVLKIELALSVAQTREGVPYPALIEIILLLIILELILEASVRLPTSIGPTITMVGGIILGQAAVEARLVSNLLIIILAATTIANSTIVGFRNSTSIRLLKYGILVLASIYGIIGILAGLFLICTYLGSISTFGISTLNYRSMKGDNKGG
jgi:hypothetical protein